MGILTMNIRNIEGRKIETITDKMAVNNRIAITNVKERSVPNINHKCISIEFTFASKYSSQDKIIAEILITGDIIYTGDDMDEIVDKWKTDKELLKSRYSLIINTIFRRCAIKALQLTEDLQLPPLIGLPFAKDNNEPI